MNGLAILCALIMDWSKLAIEKLANDIVNVSRQRNKEFVTSSLDDIHKLIDTIADDTYELFVNRNLFNMFQWIYPNRRVRREARHSCALLTKHVEVLNNDSRIYERIIECRKRVDELTRGEREFLDRLIGEYRRYGVESEHKSMSLRVEQLKAEISKQMVKLEKVIGLDEIDAADLPEQMLKGMEVVNDEPRRYGLVLRRTTYSTAMKHLHQGESRRRLEFLFNAWCLTHSKDVTDLVILRHQLANKHGFNTYVDMVSRYHTISTPERIRTFLNQLLSKLEYGYQREVEMMGRLKKHLGEDDPHVYSWDLSYLLQQWRLEYGVNDAIVSEYFSTEITVDAILLHLSGLLGVQFTEVEKTAGWDDRVRCFIMTKRGEEYMFGSFYLDLLPREGKMPVSGCFAITPSAVYPRTAQSEQKRPSISLVMSIENAEYMSHNELVNLLSQLGHLIYYLTQATTYAITEKETERMLLLPHLLSHLAWNRKFLKEISHHYQTGSAIPSDIASKVVNGRNMNSGVSIKRRVFLAIFDQLLHSSPEYLSMIERVEDKADAQELLVKTYQRVYQQVMVTEKWNVISNQGVVFPSSWFNIFDGDAGLGYVSLWAEMVSTDLYYSVLEKDKTGSKWLQVFNYLTDRSVSNPAYKLMDREPSVDNFLLYRGLTTETEEHSYFFKSDHLPVVKRDEIPDAMSMTTAVDSEKYADDLVDNHFTEFTENMTDIRELEVSEPGLWSDKLESDARSGLFVP